MGMIQLGRKPEDNQVFILLGNQSLKLRNKRTKSRTKAAVSYSVSRVKSRDGQNRSQQEGKKKKRSEHVINNQANLKSKNAEQRQNKTTLRQNDKFQKTTLQVFKTINLSSLKQIRNPNIRPSSQLV